MHQRDGAAADVRLDGLLVATGRVDSSGPCARMRAGGNEKGAGPFGPAPAPRPGEERGRLRSLTALGRGLGRLVGGLAQCCGRAFLHVPARGDDQLDAFELRGLRHVGVGGEILRRRLGAGGPDGGERPRHAVPASARPDTQDRGGSTAAVPLRGSAAGGLRHAAPRARGTDACPARPAPRPLSNERELSP